jgi:hypothetical protein
MAKTRDDIDRMQREEQKDHERAMDRDDERRADAHGNRYKLSDGERRQNLGAMRERKQT